MADNRVRRARSPHRGVSSISRPSKALNNDIQRNLEGPHSRLTERFRNEGLDFPDIRVAARSVDTPQQERERMKRSPPDIFITTPESLNSLLSSKGGQKMLSGFGTVILDEIHAVADSKRGTYLMSAGERLALFSGEFQRIVLSATLRPISLIADFVGGRHNSTLLFVNSRRMAEKLSRYIREPETGCTLITVPSLRRSAGRWKCG